MISVKGLQELPYWVCDWAIPNYISRRQQEDRREQQDGVAQTPAPLEPQDPRVTVDLQEPQVTALLDQPDHLELRVMLDPLASQVIQEHQDLKENQVRIGQNEWCAAAEVPEKKNVAHDSTK